MPESTPLWHECGTAFEVACWTTDVERRRVGLRRSFRTAWRTGSPITGAGPVGLGLWWWWRGVPVDRLDLADTPSRWDLMSSTERVVMVLVVGGVLLLFAILIAIALVVPPANR